MCYSLTKSDSTVNATHSYFEVENYENKSPHMHNQKNEEDETLSLSSCSPTTDHPNGQRFISEDDEDSASISTVETCQYNCQNCTCCFNESCIEETINLKWCPNDTRSQSTQVPTVHSPVEETSEYKIKELTNYLGMKDRV